MLSRCIGRLAGVVGLVAAGCAGPGGPTTGPAPVPPAPWTARRVAVIEGLDVPESVVITPGTGVGYVSNIVAPKEGEGYQRYWADDSTGFISRLGPGGTLDAPRWRESNPAYRLHSAKGLCILGGCLYAADNTRVLRFDIAANQAPAVLTVPGAMQLNDMASDGRFAYVSDTGAGKVWRLREGGAHEAIPAPAGVNGIAFAPVPRPGPTAAATQPVAATQSAARRMFAVSWTLHEIYELDPAGKAPPRALGLASHFTSLDGLEVLEDGCLVASDFKAGKVFLVTPEHKTVHLLIDNVPTAADLGIDRERGLLYVPLFMHDRVEVFKIERG